MMDSVQNCWKVDLDLMAGVQEEDQQQISARLRSLPRALGYASHAAFAAAMGISPTRWNNAVMSGNLGKDLAFTLYARIPGMRIEWLWFGDRSMVPDQLMRKLDAAAESPPSTSRKRITRTP